MEFNLFVPQMRLSFDQLVIRAQAAEAHVEKRPVVAQREPRDHVLPFAPHASLKVLEADRIKRIPAPVGERLRVKQ